MRHSFPRLGAIDAYRLIRVVGVWLILCLLGFSALPVKAAPPAVDITKDWSTAETEHFRFHTQSDDPNAATALAAAIGPYLETGLYELTLLFPGGTPTDLITIYGFRDAAAYQQSIAALPTQSGVAGAAKADPAALDISLQLPQFDKLSAVEIENVLRHELSHVVVGIASGGKIPWGFDEGIAQYVERPVNERLARTASLVQVANESNTLLSWFELNATNGTDDPNQAAAQSYAIIAFLIDRFELQPLRTFLAGLQTSENWRSAMNAAYARDPYAIEDQYKEDLRRWTSSKWRDNLIAGFDLEPARELLDQANYAGAKSTLEPSLTLYSQLDDATGFEAVRALVAQCDIGIQAETLMTQAQDALTQHSYERAQNLLTQAELQFNQLPVEQRPTEILAVYHKLADDGVAAGVQLDNAELLSVSWRDYVDARAGAVESGTAFATIGNPDQSARAQGLVEKLDTRQRRIVMALAGLAALTFIWLAFWTRSRGPAELDWGGS